MGQILNPFLISWFSRADYPAVRLLDLGVRMPASFDEWLARALAICLQIEAQHGTAERVFVHSKAFSEWCRDNLRPTNERSLNEFIHWSQSSSPLASGLLPRPHETPESEELQQLTIGYGVICRSLPVTPWLRSGGAFLYLLSNARDQRLYELLSQATVVLPPTLQRSVHTMHLLGDAAGSEVQQLVAILSQYNRMVELLKSELAHGTVFADGYLITESLHLEAAQPLIDKAIELVGRIQDGEWATSPA